jgi:hypothetical protein
MDTINKSHIAPSLLATAYTYARYRSMIDSLLAVHKTTGSNHAEDMLQHTRMNVQRMKRLDKTAQLQPDLLAQLKGMTQAQTWLVISEAWCGDAAQNLPYLQLVAAASEKIALKIVLRDEHLELMDRFLTAGGRSIPKLILLHADTHEVLADWGPRPAAAQSLYLDLKAQQLPYMEASTQLHKWYADNKGLDLQAELLSILQGLG